MFVHDLMLSFMSPSLPPSPFISVLLTADAQAWSSRGSLLSVSESDFSRDVLNDLSYICQLNQENKVVDSYLYVTFSVLSRRIGHSSRSWLLVRGWLLHDRN